MASSSSSGSGFDGGNWLAALLNLGGSGFTALSQWEADRRRERQERQDREAEQQHNAARIGLLRTYIAEHPELGLGSWLQGNAFGQLGNARTAAPQPARFDWQGLIGGAMQGAGTGLAAGQQQDQGQVPPGFWEWFSQQTQVSPDPRDDDRYMDPDWRPGQ